MSPESSGEKTEKATPKKREDARKEGQVLRSTDMSAAILMLSFFAALRGFGGYMFEGIVRLMEKFFRTNVGENPIIDIPWLNAHLTDLIIDIIMVLIPIFVVALIVGLAVNLAQVGFKVTPKVIMPKFNKISPMQGFKRIFSMRSLVEMIKTIGKVTIIGVVVYQEYMKRFGEFPNLMGYDLHTSAAAIVDMCMAVAFNAGIAFIVLGAFDFLYQWWEFEKNLRMTKQEVKDEYKQIEGDPKIKSKIKEKQRQIAMSRMMQSVPKADVVITNPTHYAIALRYDDKSDSAPVCLAKGKDYMAQRIKAKAREAGIEIVENKPLAQALYVAVEIGDPIPEDLFASVAEILAFIYAQKNPRTRTARTSRA